MSTSKGRVLVAMSGGVDSSVAAALLKEQGYDVVGVIMQVWDYSQQCDIEEGNGTCCSSTDVDDARAVADRLDIPFYVMNCEEKFKEKVIQPFVDSYFEGKTPLPCVDCNTYLKFDHLIQKMKELNCDFLATGHYAQITTDSKGQAWIETSTDDWKDQTYFLFTMDPEVVPKLLFPIGGMKKEDVRLYAENNDLVVARKKDSTGICFVGKKGYSQFIEDFTGKTKSHRPGLFKRYPEGDILGEHTGIHNFTFGQRRGLGLDHHASLFVIKTDAESNTVWLGPEEYLYQSHATIVNTHWLGRFSDNEEVRVKIRYHHKGAPAKIHKVGDRAEVVFTEPQRAITPGQAAVVYCGDRLLGGGWFQ